MADAEPKDIRDLFQLDQAEWADIRKEGQKDMRYVAGDPWEEKDRKARKDAGRPCLSLDELGQYVNQCINDVRQNKRGIKVSPVGRGATDETAAFRQGKIRDIEYRSNAQQAYTTGFENAIQRGYGFWRIKAQYVQESVSEPTAASLDQELRIEPIVNPDMVTPDPYALRSDFSDGKRLFYHESWSKQDFERRFKKAETIDSGAWAGMMQSAGETWVQHDRILIAEYWVKELARTRTLYLLKPSDLQGQPIATFADKTKPESDRILKSREVDEFKVVQYFTNGLEILSKADWPGQSIPFVSCYGKVLFVDTGGGSKRTILSLIRLARDPYMLYCYYRTCEAELVGMTPKFPYFAYDGQLAPDQLLNLQKSLHEPIAVILVKPVLDAAGGQVLGMPQRQPYEPPIQGLEVGAEAARRAIQAAMAISPLPSQAQRHNEKSGVALRQIEESGQKGTFHFVDHYDEAITRTGAILDELIPHYYDTARDTSIRKPDDSVSMVRINDPNAQQDGQPAHIQTDLGDHDVTISVGPAMASEREASSAFADVIVSSPEIAQVIGPQKMAKLIGLSIKLKGLGPIGDEMAEVIDPAPKQDDPNAAKQQMGQMQQQIQEMQQALQKAGQLIQTKQVEAQSREKIAALDNATTERLQIKLQSMKDATQIACAHIAANAKGMAIDAHAQEEAQALSGDASAQAFDHQHDLEMAQLGHQHALESGDQGHQQALEQGEQGQDFSLEQQEQAAELAPEPAGAEAGA